MSVFTNGGGDLKSTHLPSALFEIARKLDNAERSRNAAAPTLTPRRNITVAASYDTGTVTIDATIPFTAPRTFFKY